MKLTADPVGGNYIQAFTDGTVVVNGHHHHHPLLVSASLVLADWFPGPVSALEAAHLEPALAQEPEVILLGTGPTHRFVCQRLATTIMARGIGFEVMATGAACRTYNLLLAEDRRVVAALFPG